MALREIRAEELKLNPFTKIGSEWMLITAGDEEKHNTMTAAWGGLGFLWKKNVAIAYIRPQRYTREFVDANDKFTLSFFGDSHRDALTLLGRKSGRDGDKIAESGLTAIPVDATTAFAEAELVLVCKKLYRQEMDPACFLDKSLDAQCYAEHDYHIMYVGEIEKVLVKE